MHQALPGPDARVPVPSPALLAQFGHPMISLPAPRRAKFYAARTSLPDFCVFLFCGCVANFLYLFLLLPV